MSAMFAAVVSGLVRQSGKVGRESLSLARSADCARRGPGKRLLIHATSPTSLKIVSSADSICQRDITLGVRIRIELQPINIRPILRFEGKDGISLAA
jgi:hypothetical protein